ncbi:hypothetical protein ACJZTR_00585 [Neorickettsia risticii]
MFISRIFSRRRVLCIFALFVLLFASVVLIWNLLLLHSAKTSPYSKVVWVLNTFAALFTFLFFLCCTANEIAACTGWQRKKITPRALDLKGIVSRQHVFTPESPEIHKISICGSKKQLEMLSEIVEQALTTGMQELQNKEPSQTNSLDYVAPDTPFSAPRDSMAPSIIQELQSDTPLIQLSGHVPSDRH